MFQHQNNTYMKLFFSICTLVVAFALMAFTAADHNNIKIDTKATKLSWKAYKVTGDHWGSLRLQSGTLVEHGGSLVGGNFVIDMTTMTVDDIPADKGGKDLLGHLKSADFFDVDNNKTASFTITKIYPTGKPGDYRITGDMTIKNIKKEIKFNANYANGKGQATLKLDRTDFNVRYGSGSFFDNLGDKAIYDEFDLTVDLVAAK